MACEKKNVIENEKNQPKSTCEKLKNEQIEHIGLVFLYW
jgi:hypothetical protein